MTNVVNIKQAEKARDLKQILAFCDAVELIAAHEPNEDKRAEKLARVERTRATATESLAKITGVA